MLRRRRGCGAWSPERSQHGRAKLSPGGGGKGRICMQALCYDATARWYLEGNQPKAGPIVRMKRGMGAGKHARDGLQSCVVVQGSGGVRRCAACAACEYDR